MIRFHCRCGKRIKVPADVAGKRVRCPFCGRTVQAPRAREDTTPGLDALAQAVRANGGARSPSRSPLAAARQKVKKQELPTSAQLISRRVGTIPNHKKAVLIGIVTAVVLVALVLGLSALMAHWSGESEKKPADQSAPSGANRGAPGELFKNVPFEK